MEFQSNKSLHLFKKNAFNIEYSTANPISFILPYLKC